jgi:small subunit ribosomal protein S16
MGRKKRPVYAIVAADTRSPRDGRYIEDLGRYSPLDEPASYELKGDRILHWLQEGAQPTDTVKALLSREGIMLELHMRRKNRTEEDITSAVEAHRAARAAKAASSGKMTSEQRRLQAMKDEEKRAAEHAAELAKERAAAAAKAKEAAAAATAAAEAEREAAAKEAQAEQAEANAAQADAEAPAPAPEATPVVEEAPAVEAEAVAEAAPAEEAEAAVETPAAEAEEAAPAEADEEPKDS